MMSWHGIVAMNHTPGIRNVLPCTWEAGTRMRSRHGEIEWPPGNSEEPYLPNEEETDRCHHPTWSAEGRGMVRKSI